MGMHGPLTAQALGRSPYDDLEWDEHDGDTQETTQQFDHRGRPVNPETKRINRDIIRSHNEVMTVIGVAESEPNAGPELESEIQHAAYEENIGVVLASMAGRCIETVGVFGVHGLRQRILIYKRYSEIPFWSLYQAARKDFSFSRDVLPGVPTSLLSNYLERHIAGLWVGRVDRIFARQFIHEIWAYVRVHLCLFVATQRLGIVPSRWFPPLSYFVPFSETSPIPAPPPLEDISPLSILKWVGGLCISATPFLVWVMAQRMRRDWKPQLWKMIFKHLPNTRFAGKKIPPPPPPPPPPAALQPSSSSPRTRPESNNAQVQPDEGMRAVDQLPGDTGPVEAVRRRPSNFSGRGDDYASDEDENEGVSATLISFDVEATESNDAPSGPSGVWSAELRPSMAPDGRINGTPQYLDTLLTQLPALIASQMFVDSVTRIVMVPYEATALRLVARAIRRRQGLDCSDIFYVNFFSLNWTGAINLLGAEFLHLLITSELWAAFTSISQYFHMTKEEWIASSEDGNNNKVSTSWWDF